MITLSKPEKDISYNIAYIWNLKKKKDTNKNLFTKQKQTHRHRKQTYGSGNGREGTYVYL